MNAQGLVAGPCLMNLAWEMVAESRAGTQTFLVI